MKKILTAALIPAFIAGATTATFAAGNPFSDVPAGHWAYDSVIRLANKDIINGYGDGTFRGKQSITRYEMAQIVAKLMDNADKNPQKLDAASRSDLDKLMVEFRAELDNLGVRVDELEKRVDRVKWTGEVRYRYWNDRESLPGGGNNKKMVSRAEIRLFPTAEINKNWTAQARFTATANVREDTTSDAKLTYVFAEGKYNKFKVRMGRMPLFTNSDSGIVADDNFSGLQLSFGDKVKFMLEGGRWNYSSKFGSNPADYYGAELLYNDNSRFNIGAGYRHFKSKGVESYTGEEKANVWSVGAGYKFGGGIKLSGAYAQNSKPNDYKRGYNVELAYNGANRKNPGSWGLYGAYRYIGRNVGFAPTYNTFSQRANKKGFEFGASWSPLENTLTQLAYFHGKTLDTNKTDKTLFGRVSFFF